MPKSADPRSGVLDHLLGGRFPPPYPPPALGPRRFRIEILTERFAILANLNKTFRIFAF